MSTPQRWLHGRPYWLRWLTLGLLWLGMLSLGGCRTEPAENPRQAKLGELRDQGEATSAEATAQWMLRELISPGGNAKQAARARRRLDALQAKDMWSHLARALDDSVHGRFGSAPDHYMRAAQAAQGSDDPDAALVAWFSVSRARALHSNTTDLWKRWESFTEQAIERPANLGWRAHSELLDWWADEAYARADDNFEERTAKRFGCLSEVRLAGPFGSGFDAESYYHFAAEQPGPWPAVWKPTAFDDDTPRLLETERSGCSVRAEEVMFGGIFYAETFVDVGRPTDAILTAQGALAMWVDDQQVLARDLREWGVWSRFGVQVKFTPGRHRILIRTGQASISLRALDLEGKPLGWSGSTLAAAPYGLNPVALGPDPNVLRRFVSGHGIAHIPDDVTRFLAAYLAHIDGEADVANVLFEPLVKESKQASATAQTVAARFIEDDPIYDSAQASDLVRLLHQQAMKKDPGLWEPQLGLTLHKLNTQGLTSGVKELKRLTEQFPNVPGLLSTLGNVYGRLGWTAEHTATTKLLAKRFPDNTDALYSAIEAYEAEGDWKHADALIQRIRRLEPDTELLLSRALERSDYETARAELERLAKRHPGRKDLKRRLDQLLVRAGRADRGLDQLRAAVEDQPEDGSARLDLADALYAAGDHQALAHILAESLQAGADPSPLLQALDLVEGMSQLEPYRMDAKRVISDYEQAGKHLPGTAARVLDYAVVWVHADGSSRMLEHELVRIQSEEAIGRFAEQDRLVGLVLNMRVIKQDGRVFEPEVVSGKPTVTFPHLEIGDYIETEHVVSLRGDGSGDRYTSPRWFFREESIAYAHSEFVMITPKSKPLVIETTGKVPPPKISEQEGFVTHSWRVDFSPAAPSEPFSAPRNEFLPSVNVGWGASLKRELGQLRMTLSYTTPVDPRMVRLARQIVEPLPSSEKLARAKRLYRWVMDNVQEGEEVDGRRAVFAKKGNRWRALVELLRALRIQSRYALVKNHLAQPPRGPISETQIYSIVLLTIDTERGSVWLTVDEKHNPFGYVPAAARGMQGFLLDPAGIRKTQVPEESGEDLMTLEGEVELADNGSGKLRLSRRFEGAFAANVRSGLEQVAERQLHDILESRVLGQDLRGAQLESYEIESRDEYDAPLVVKLNGQVASFAVRTEQGLLITPPFNPSLGQLAALPARETPLLIGQAIHRLLRLEIALPTGANLQVGKPTTFSHERFDVAIRDRVEGSTLILEREVKLHPGRVAPESYADFATKIRAADEALSQDLLLRL